MEKTEDVEVDLCLICMEMLNRPAICLTCKNLLCYIHTLQLQKCPTCRASPFQTVIDQALENKLYHIRQKQRQSERQTAYFQCKAKNCKAQGKYKQMVLHHRDFHPYMPLNSVLYGDHFQVEEKDPVQDITDFERQRAQYAVQNTRIPPGTDKKKLVNRNQAIKMIRHCAICPNPQCLCLYSGPWGSFIGGSSGRTHFDLTQCARGKILNQTVGWKYGNWRD